MMWLGVDYYPEQWDEALMEADMDTILEMGGNIIRIAEFCWHLMEKTEGKYDFSFFDRVIAAAKRKGLHVVMGTPTATIPAWLAKKHPDILSEFEDGTKRTFGGRHVYCFNSPVMYEYSGKLVRALVEHYKDEEAIVAWQVDNEIGHEGSDICYCSQCRAAFQNYLRNKFHGDIHALNDTYGTAFWSQEYNEFDEIPIPTATITTHNPALRLDWERFRSQSIVDFMNFQRDLIKEIAPNARVMHDFPGGGLDKHVDYAQVARKLDFAAYNNYPVWGGQKEPIAPNEIAFGLDYIRGLKQQNFWITEAIMGAQGHDITGFLPRPNQAKLWSWQGLARGCASMMYFRYRGATKGAEQFCYGILDADNVKRRKFYEVKSLFEEAKQYQEVLSTPVDSQVAVVYDYDSLAAFRIQRQSVLLDCQNEMKKYHKVFYDANVMVDVVSEQADFTGYKVLILPQIIITKPAFRSRVEEFAGNGGTVVLTFRSAVKDADNNLVFGEMVPVGYRGLAGVYVDETESLQELDAFPLVGEGICRGASGTGGIFRDMLAAEDAEVLYRYGDKFYTHYAAITRKACGKGMIYYIGCAPDEETLTAVLGRIMEDNGIKGTVSEPGVEVVTRGAAGRRVRIWMNHNDYAVQTEIGELDAFECRIVESSR